jgi:hypothetical protein
MKKQKNKKFYNYTDKQKRRDRSRKSLWTASKDYRQMFNRSREAKSKQVLIKILAGYEAEFEPERKDVLWYYW